MALDDLLDFEQFRNDIAVHGASLQGQADEGAGGVTEHLGIHIVARSGNDAIVDETLDALMNCSTRYTTYLSHILAGNAGIVHHNFKNFFIKSVNLFHEIKFLLTTCKCSIFFSSCYRIQ